MSHYSTHAAEDLAILLKTKFEEDRETIAAVLERLKNGVKFQLPLNGRYLNKNDPFTHEDFELFKLPYSVCVLEYACKFEKWEMKEYQSSAPRRIMICRQRAEGIGVVSIYWQEDSGCWGMAPVEVIIPRDVQMKVIKDGRQSFLYHVEEMTPDYNRLLGRKLGLDRETLVKRFGEECLDDMIVVFEFCLAVNCSNVDLDTVSPPTALNKKRARSGKLPFYEFKVLKLKSNSTRYALQPGSSSATATTDIVTRRQHLRRGHIRHYNPAITPRYRKKAAVWIEAMVVGDPTKGSIDKEYQLT